MKNSISSVKYLTNNPILGMIVVGKESLLKSGRVRHRREEEMDDGKRRRYGIKAATRQEVVNGVDCVPGLRYQHERMQNENCSHSSSLDSNSAEELWWDGDSDL
jgi:aspartate carbamoyltransferase catalytic subunit